MVQPLCLYTVLGFEGVLSLHPIKSLQMCGETFVVVLEVGEPGVQTGCLSELIASCTPNITWLHPWCGTEMGLPHIWNPPNQFNAAFQRATGRGELPPPSVLSLGNFLPRQSWFCGGTCGLWVTGEHVLQAMGHQWHQQLRGGKQACGGKVLVCKSAIPNLIPLGFCPGSWF